MRETLAALFLTAALTALSMGPVGAQPVPPDLILTGGKVFTADPARRYAEAVAIRGERFVAVGTTAEISALAGPGTRRIDLQGRVVIPGINDAHTHQTPEPQGTELRLGGMEPTFQEVLDALAAAVRQAPKGSWIFGTIGYTAMSDPAATRATLDRVAPDHKVVLGTFYGHGEVLGSRALAALGIADEEPDPPGGSYEREPGTKRLNGRLQEYAHWRTSRRLAESVTDEQAAAALSGYAREAARFGITSIQNMSMLPPERYLRVLEKARVPLRVRVIRFPLTQPAGRDLAEGRKLPLHPPGLPRVTVLGTKWILDGTPYERGIAVRAPFKDRPDWRGRTNFPPAEIQAMLRESLADGDPLLVHAVGDGTIAQVFDAMEAVGRDVDWKSQRVRIEHGDLMLPDLIERARRLGVVVVQNPSHLTLAEMMGQRFGPEHAYQPLRSLLAAGVPLALGSDGPLNPYLNIMFAALHPARPSEGITVEQAVEAYTRGSAYAERAEQEKGTIAPGKLADLAVLSQDIFAIPPGGLPKTESVLTLVGGEVVHDAGVVKPAAPPA